MILAGGMICSIVDHLEGGIGAACRVGFSEFDFEMSCDMRTGLNSIVWCTLRCGPFETTKEAAMLLAATRLKKMAQRRCLVIVLWG